MKRIPPFAVVLAAALSTAAVQAQNTQDRTNSPPTRAGQRAGISDQDRDFVENAAQSRSAEIQASLSFRSIPTRW